MRNTKEDILKKHTVLVTTDFHCMDKKKHKGVYQNIFFYIPQKKEYHKGYNMSVNK